MRLRVTALFRPLNLPVNHTRSIGSTMHVPLQDQQPRISITNKTVGDSISIGMVVRVTAPCQQTKVYASHTI